MKPMKRHVCAVLIMMTLTFAAAAQDQSPKSLGEIARKTREARLRKTVEETVAEMCSKADDPKMQETYPKIQEKCKDKAALIQIAFESALKKLKESADNANRLQDEDKSWMSKALAAQTAPADSVAVTKSRMDRACNYGLSTTPGEITRTMADCARATKDWEAAITTEAAAQNRNRVEAMTGSASAGQYLISLTGTPGLPVTGTCSFAGKSISFDDVLPAEHVATAGRGVLCSFVKKYVQGTLRMQIIQNGAVRDQAETEASYGVVSLSMDW